MNWADFVAALIPTPATITVEAYSGPGARGDVFTAPASVTPCVVENTSRRVRTQSQDTAGEEVTSATTVYAPLGTVAPAGSRVTLPGGRVTRVIATSELTAAGWDIPEHIELSLE